MSSAWKSANALRQRRRQHAAREDHLAHGGVVGGERDGAADMHVVGRRHLGVELEIERRRGVLADQVEAAHVDQRLVGLRRLELAGHHQFAGSGERADGGLVIGDDPAHLVDRAFAETLVVIGVAHDGHLRAAVPALQRIGAGAGDVGREIGLAVVAALIGLHQLLVEDEDGGHGGQERREGFRQRELHRLGVGRGDRAGLQHVGEQVGRTLVDAQQPLDRVDDVARLHRRAVGELGVVAQLERDFLGVVRDLPAFGQLGDQVALGIDADETVIEVHRRHVVGVVGDLRRIDGAEDLHGVHRHDGRRRKRALRRSRQARPRRSPSMPKNAVCSSAVFPSCEADPMPGQVVARCRSTGACQCRRSFSVAAARRFSSSCGSRGCADVPVSACPASTFAQSKDRLQARKRIGFRQNGLGFPLERLDARQG